MSRCRVLAAPLLFCLTVVIPLAAATDNAGNPPLSQVYAELQAADEDILFAGDVYDVGRLAALYESRAARTSLPALGDAELRLLFRSAHLVAFRSHAAVHLRAMRTALDELRHRSLDWSGEGRDMVAMYVAARDFRAARALNAQLPAARRSLVPAFVDETGNGPSRLELHRADGRWSLVRRHVDLSGRHVVIVASPACAFSRQFFADVQKDPELRRYVGRALVLLPQTSNLLLDEVADWNAANPDLAFSYAYRAAEWPALDGWTTPTFYFLQDGRLEAKLLGWKPQITGGLLRQQLRRWERLDP